MCLACGWEYVEGRASLDWWHAGGAEGHPEFVWSGG